MASVPDVLWRFGILELVPRTRRVGYPGAIYHVMRRGDRQENVFVDDVDLFSRPAGGSGVGVATLTCFGDGQLTMFGDTLIQVCGLD